MKNRTFRLGLALLALVLMLSQTSQVVNADTHSQGGMRVSIPALPLSGATPIPVDPPWVARQIGRKPSEWPCTWDSPFNLPLASAPNATYSPLTSPLTGAWSSHLPIYVATMGDPLGNFYTRDGAGTLQSAFLAQSIARSALTSNIQTFLLNSSHQTPDPLDQIHLGLTTHLSNSDYRPVRTDWPLQFYLPAGATPLDKTDGSPDGLIDIVQPDGTVVEANGAVRVDNGLVAAYGSTWDAMSTCTFYQNGVQSSMIPALAGTIRAGELTNGVIPHALSGDATNALLNNQAISPAGGYSPIASNGIEFALGARLAIPAGLDIYSQGWSAQGIIIAKALQDYGLYIVDRGSKGGNDTSASISIRFQAGATDAEAWLAGTGEAELGTIAQQLQVVQINSSDPTVSRRAEIAPVNWFNNNGDNQPPVPPNGLTGESEVAHNGVFLSWSPAVDPVGIAAYYIYRNGQIVGSVPGTKTGFRDTSYAEHPITPGLLTPYSYTVKAMNSNRVLSSDSNTFTYTVPFYAVEVYNGGFEDDLGGWTLNYTAPVPPPSAAQGIAATGNRSALIPPGASIEQAVDVQSGQSYRIQGQFMASDNTRFMVCDQATCPYTNTVATSSGTWTSVQGNVDSGNAQSLTVRIVNQGSSPAYADNIQLMPYGLPPTDTPTVSGTITPPTATATPSGTWATDTPTFVPQTFTPTVTGTLTATPTFTPTVTDTPTSTPTMTDTPTTTPTGTWVSETPTSIPPTLTSTPITPTPLPTIPTLTPTYLVTWTPSPTKLPTATWTMTPLPACGSGTLTPVNCVTPSNTPTNTPIATITLTYTPSATVTLTPSNTLTPSLTFTSSMTPTPTATATNTSTATFTATLTFTPTSTATATNTFTATATFTPSNTFTPSLTPTPTATATATATATTTSTATFTATPSNTFTATATATTTATPLPTLTATNTPQAVSSCPAYPIALSNQALNGLAVGSTVSFSNGTQPGNFGWLSWTGASGESTLVTSLTVPGNSQTYVNPANANDHLLLAGKSAFSRPHASNSPAIRDALTALESVVITVPVWDTTSGSGNNTTYHLVAFASIQIVSYQLPGQNVIVVKFLGYTCTKAVITSTPPTSTVAPTLSGATFTPTFVPSTKTPTPVAVIPQPGLGLASQNTAALSSNQPDSAFGLRYPAFLNSVLLERVCLRPSAEAQSSGNLMGLNW